MQTESKKHIAVIGGGILGATIAYYLSRSGVKISLLEQGAAGCEGASRYSGGIVRSFDFDPVVAEWSAYGTWLLRRWEEHGWPGKSPLTPTGLYYLLNGTQDNNISEGMSAISPYGCEMDVLRGIDANRRCSVLRAYPEDMVLYDGSAGLGDVRLTVRNLLAGTVSLGGSVLEHCRVQSVRNSDTGGALVVLGNGKSLGFDFGIIATGCLARELVPAIPIIAKTIPMIQLAGLPDSFNFPLIDANSETYLRPIGFGQSLMGWSGKAFTPGEEMPHLDWDEANTRLGNLCKRLNLEALPQVINSFQGYDAYSSDCRPIAGFVRHFDAFYVASGLSGRGYKLSLGLGRMISRVIAGHLEFVTDDMEDHPASESLLSSVTGGI